MNKSKYSACKNGVCPPIHQELLKNVSAMNSGESNGLRFVLCSIDEETRNFDTTAPQEDDDLAPIYKFNVTTIKGEQ